MQTLNFKKIPIPILLTFMVVWFFKPCHAQYHKLYGTTLGNNFSKVIPDGQEFYLLGVEDGNATISRINISGSIQWTEKLNFESGWMDGIVTPSGNLLVVGFSGPWDNTNKSLIGEITDQGVFDCLQLMDIPGHESLFKIDKNLDNTYSVLGAETPIGTLQDVIILNVSTPGCIINSKKRFDSPFFDNYANDIEVLSNGDILVAGAIGNSAIIYHMTAAGQFIGGAQNPGQFTYQEIVETSGGIIAIANSNNFSNPPRIMRFDQSLIPVWEASIFGLTLIHHVIEDANGDILVVGTGIVGGISRSLIVKIDDNGGTTLPGLTWGGAKYFGNVETSNTPGSLAEASSGLIAYADGRSGHPNGFGLLDGYMALIDNNLTSDCTYFIGLDLIIESTLFDSPSEIELLHVDVSPGMETFDREEIILNTVPICSVDSCTCAEAEFSLFQNNTSYILECDGSTPVLLCPIGEIGVSGFFGCVNSSDGKPCPTETPVSWILRDPNGSPIDGGTTSNISSLLFQAAYFVINGTYVLTVSTLCPGQLDSCVCVMDWIVECDSCCTDSIAFFKAAEEVETFGTLGNCTISFLADSLTDCMQITYDWGDGQSSLPITGNNVPVSHTYSSSNIYYVCYTIEEISNNEVCWEYTHCDSILIICDSCCSDYELFCQNVMNAINISVNNSNCKATVDINGLPECYSIENINWGDGNIDLGPFENGDSPMHTYSSVDNYTISISAASYDFSTSPESLCFIKTFIDSVEINCDTVLDQECCAYEIKLINQNQQSNVKKVRLSALCETKICCAESDAWSQDLVGTEYVEWYLADGSNIPYGTTINNDFIVYLDKSSSTHEMMVEWFDASNNVVCRHFITMACNGMYTEDENWLQYTSTTQLNDPNLLVFAVREPDADEEITDCDPASRNSCPLQYTVYCNGGNSYLVYLQAPSGLTDYKWEGFENGIPFVINNNTTKTANFSTSQGGSYHIGFTSKLGRHEECNGSIDIILPEMIPDFTWELQPCGTDVLFTPTGWSDLNAVSTITWYSLDGLPGFPIVSNSAFIHSFLPPSDPNIPDSWDVVMVIQDIFGCSYQVTHTVIIDLRCKPSFKIDYLLCRSGCISGSQPVQVSFTNTSTGGDCASGIDYSWNFGDGSSSMIENALNFNKPNNYIVTCPTGSSFPVTLTMTSTVNGIPCTEQITQTIEIAPCEVSISIPTICPDGKLVFSANVPGFWSFPGSVAIAPWPHSDKPDIYGRQMFVAVRYNSGPHLVSFTGFCPNGGHCTIHKEIFVDQECYAVNDKVTHEYYEPSNGSWVIKSKFIQRQFAFIHRITAKTIFKRQKSIGGYTYYRRAKASEIESSFTGQIFTSDCSVGCNYSDPNSIYASNPESNKKKSRALDARIGKFKSWINSLTSTHRVKINSNNPNSIYINLFLGHDCDNPKWNCPPD